jgi:hypothetical protein
MITVVLKKKGKKEQLKIIYYFDELSKSWVYLKVIIEK